MNSTYSVYILTNNHNKTFYIGMTNDLQRRIAEHRLETTNGFTKKYQLKKLVYFEQYPKPIEAIQREKQLKNWHREWKINLIKESNPTLQI